MIFQLFVFSIIIILAMSGILAFEMAEKSASRKIRGTRSDLS